MRANLVLSDGSVFEGESLGMASDATGEVVFNTGMTGYQEILTDPSYCGQMVTLTYPLIGNYGINSDDFESRKVQVNALIVREAETVPSNWRSKQSIDSFLKERGITAIQGIDTRALTRKLRSHGVMMGIITTSNPDIAKMRLNVAPGYSTTDLTQVVTTDKPYCWLVGGERPYDLAESAEARTEDPRFRISLLDCGVKYNILRSLAKYGCETTVYPCTTSSAELLKQNPDGIMLSPGPGDPALLGYLVNTVKELAGKKPVLAVCLGNQILGKAFGAETFKMKFGHRGSNHPVKDLVTGKVYITSQNHGFALDPDGLRDGMEVSQINLNDGTVEGLRHKELPIFSIQYHPEASPGPTDSAYFFEEFVKVLSR